MRIERAYAETHHWLVGAPCGDVESFVALYALADDSLPEAHLSTVKALKRVAREAKARV